MDKKLEIICKPGKDGKTPTKEELLQLIEPLIPEPLKGDDGKDYILTENDKQDIAQKIIPPVVEKIIEKTETIIEKPIVTEITKEVAVTDTPEVLVEKLNTLSKVLDFSVIKNFPDIKKGGYGIGYLKDASDVSITNLLNNQVLKWNSTTNRWENATDTAGTGTVTNVSALTLGTSGTDLSSTVANPTTTPVITLNVPTASATNRGALSSADWSTFNSKQNSLGYTAEDVANKSTNTSLGTSDTLYPSQKATKTYVDTGLATKPTATLDTDGTLAANSDTRVASQKATKTYADTKEVPLTFSTGLTRSTNTVTVNTSQNISTLSNLTTNGFVKTSGGTGALSVDTTTYIPSAVGQTIYTSLSGKANTNTTNTTNECYYMYLGRASSAFTSVTVGWRLAQSAITVTWAEMAIYTGTPNPVATSGLLTRKGYTDITTDITAATGLKTTVISLSGIAAGDHLWFAFGNQALTTGQLRSTIADNLRSGLNNELPTASNPQPSINATVTPNLGASGSRFPDVVCFFS